MLQSVLSSRPGAWLMEKAVVEPARGRLEHSLAHPAECQRRIFHELIAQARDTDFGRQHGFRDIATIQDFASAVPVAKYEDLRPFFDRVYYDSEPDVVWPGTVQWFVESSGTTGPKKRLPVTREGWQRLYLDTAKLYVAALGGRVGTRSLLRGKSIFFPGKIHRAEHATGVLVGDITALSVHLVPGFLDFVRTPGKAITIDPDRNWEERLVRMAASTIHEDVVHLAGLPTWLVHFGRIVQEMTGAPTLRQVWPNLVAATMGGVNPAPYIPAVDELAGADADGAAPLLHSEVYNGTEGFYATQIDDGDMALLADAGVFYEFVARKDAVNGDLSRAVRLGEVEIGRDYAPVISTYCGLWRYLIGDTVRFTATRPYRVRVTGRVSQYLNVAGEELLVANVDDAMRSVCAALGGSLRDYTGAVVPPDEVNGLPRHLWLVALDGPATVDEQVLAEALDRELIENHFDYAKMRNAGARGRTSFGLGPPIVVIVPAGCFVRWLDENSSGGAGGQSKVPRLNQDARIAAQVLRLAGSDRAHAVLGRYPALDAGGQGAAVR